MMMKATEYMEDEATAPAKYDKHLHTAKLMKRLRVHKEEIGQHADHVNTNIEDPDQNQNSFNYVNSSKPINYRSGRFQTSLLLLILFFCAISMWLIKAKAMHDAQLQEGIAEDIIRFHVIANSDSDEDQALKLLVKESLVDSLSPLLKNTESLEEARYILSEGLDDMEKIAEECIRQSGYTYPVKVTLENCYFPMKIYGDYTFPPGYYEALRVQIGEAKGKNWWCVMFPPLCFVDETYSIVDESSGEKLKYLLSEEEYETLVSNKTPVKIKFKLWEAIKELFR